MRGCRVDHWPTTKWNNLLNQSGMSISWKVWIYFFPMNWKRSKCFLAWLQWVRWVTTELVAGHFSASRSKLNYWRYIADAWFKLTGFRLADAVNRSCITLLKPIWLLFALTMDYSQWIWTLDRKHTSLHKNQLYRLVPLAISNCRLQFPVVRWDNGTRGHHGNSLNDWTPLVSLLL